MKPHKWAKEIKAWADGAEIEFLEKGEWLNCSAPLWDEDTEYRIKPQPKEPQYLYVYEDDLFINGKENEGAFFTQYKLPKSLQCKYLGKIKLEIEE